MSIIGVYDEKVKEEKKRYFKLFNGFDSVFVQVVDINGNVIECGNLIAINKKTGKIIRKSGFNNEIGFDLDCDSRVKVE